MLHDIAFIISMGAISGISLLATFGNVVITETPDSSDIADAIEDTDDEIDEVAEQLAAHSILSDARHEEILEGIDECRTKLLTIAEQAQTAESPLLTQLTAQIAEINAQVLSLKQSMDTMLSRPQPNVSQIPAVTEAPAEIDTENLTDVQQPVDAQPEETQQTRKRKVF